MWGRKKILSKVGLLIMQTKSALFVFLCLLFFLSFSAKAQKGLEFGPMAGASYYMGDINLYKHFYSPHADFGAFGRYHINSRYAVRLGAVFTKLSGYDKDFKNSFQNLRDCEFETSLIEASVMFEVGFLPYEIGDMKRKSFTPYLHSGLALFVASSSSNLVNFAIPIGIGIKKNIKPRLVLGVEWTFRRTFSDVIDNLTGEDLNNYDSGYGVAIDQAISHKQIGFAYNKDWYSMANLTLSYTFKLGGLGCPAYYDWK